ncbi:MAG: hypothetical protein JXA14_08205, partial [Anaerolineae bacterium]|nr:hypothetical protein [Anaerolineae bacterium]
MNRDDFQQDVPQYNIGATRNLLREAFTTRTLRRLCHDRPALRSLLHHFGENPSLEEMIDVVIVQCEKGVLLGELLAAVEEANPNQYQRYRDQLYDSDNLDAAMERLRARRDEADRRRRAMRKRQRVVNVRPLDVSHTFQDRHHERHAFCQHLADRRVRLISVVGRGGMGKTALASRVLADLERGKLPVPGEERALAVDGILYLSARSTGLGLERIYADVGRMLGEPATSQLAAHWAAADRSLAEKVEFLLEAMQGGLYLILLDNLEDHLAASGDIADEGLRLFVDRCLTQPSGAQLIVTSREQVKIAPAALPGVRSLALREGLPPAEAMAMLRELDPQGELGLQNAPGEVLYCAAVLCQGIPRGLELLAGILFDEPTTRLSELLADKELFGQQVVECLMAEGYRRLGEEEQRVMEALAVFDRPVEETALAYLLHPWFPGLHVRRTLSRLVRSYFASVNRITN